MGINYKSKEVPPGKVKEFTMFGKDAIIRDRTPEEKKFDNLRNEIGELTNSDDWWLDRILERKSIYNQLDERLKPEQIDKYLDSFKSIYDNDWWRPRSLAPGPIVRRDPRTFFLAQDYIRYIIRIGECINILGGKNALDCELIEKLQNRATFQSAVFELESATCFTQAGFTVIMYPIIPSGCKPEGKISKNRKKIYYEITERHFSGHQIQSSKTESHIIDWIHKNIGLVDGTINFLIKEDDPEKSADELLDFLKESLKKELFNEFPYHFKNDKFEIFIFKETSDGSWFGIGGLEPDPGYIITQWMKKLFKKAKQLPSGECGVIIGSPLFLWGPEEVNAAIKALSRELQINPHTRISGIILCAKHVERSGIFRHMPRVIFNPRADIKNEDEIKDMATALFTYPDW